MTTERLFAVPFTPARVAEPGKGSVSHEFFEWRSPTSVPTFS
jgi:hypothetical protein